MNWIANFVRPRIKSLMGASARAETPENLWKKCASCGEMIFHRDLALAQNVCPQCGFHMRIGPAERFAAIFDAGDFEILPQPEVPSDPLKFRGEKRYVDELKASRAKTSRPEALTAARGTIEGMPVINPYNDEYEEQRKRFGDVFFQKRQRRGFNNPDNNNQRHGRWPMQAPVSECVVPLAMPAASPDW